jgi:hypothetical protein
MPARRRKGPNWLLLLFCLGLGMLIGLWWQAGHPWPGPWPPWQQSPPVDSAPPPPTHTATGNAQTGTPTVNPPADPATGKPHTDTPIGTPRGNNPADGAAPLPPPAPEVWLSRTQVSQGEFTVVHLLGFASPDAVQVTGLADQGPWIPYQGGWAKFLAVKNNAKPGAVPVTVTWPGGQWQATVQVEKYPFTEDRLTVSQEQADSWYDPQVAKDSELLNTTRRRSSGTPLWQGRWIWPVTGRITTYFGEIRYVNGTPTGQHTGTDIAAPTGTPVKATNGGRVVIVRKMVLTGNTVVVDHGAGIFSLYAHLDTTAVQEGQRVKRGEVVGTVGSTGFSTGPHLHWTMSVGNTFVNPQLFADQSLLADRLPGPQLLR